MERMSNELDAAKCFRLSEDRIQQLHAEAHANDTTVQQLLELKVFGVVARRQRARHEFRSMARRPHTRRPAVEFRMARAQLIALQDEAASIGISVQALLELKVFGKIAPRKRPRRDAQLVTQDMLGLGDLTATTEASNAA